MRSSSTSSFTPLGLHHPRDRYAGPGTDDLGYLLGADLAAEQPFASGRLLRGAAGRTGRGVRFVFARLGLLRFELFGEFFLLHVQLVKLLIILLADGHAGRLLFLYRGGELARLVLGVHQPLADLLRVAQPALFEFPLLAEIGELLPQLGHFLLDLGTMLPGMFLGLFGQLPIGQFELHEPPLDLVDLGRHALQFHRQPAGGLVHQVDRLVGQKAVGDVTVRQVGRRHQGRVLYPHAAMMGLVARLQPAEDRYGVFDRRLADVDRLESPFEGGVLFDVLAILVERRGAYAAKLAAGQRGLEQIGRVAPPLGLAGADDRVQLVDEQDYVAGVFDLAEDGL